LPLRTVSAKIGRCDKINLASVYIKIAHYPQLTFLCIFCRLGLRVAKYFTAKSGAGWRAFINLVKSFQAASLQQTWRANFPNMRIKEMNYAIVVSLFSRARLVTEESVTKIFSAQRPRLTENALRFLFPLKSFETPHGWVK
jgi:hypothetical protein